MHPVILIFWTVALEPLMYMGLETPRIDTFEMVIFWAELLELIAEGKDPSSPT
uniref:Uncharacterized protein n=1 Tax=uncultured Bacteroidota bacterium TaxID=152509 RepID=H5SIE7_9BACT|nr:hypothetical protein HGMM_F32H02C06 [uncultured Bacteroidetes bacterium]